MSGRFHIALILAAAGLSLAACDAIEPVERDLLVLEAFVEPGEALPEIVVRRTRPLSMRYPLDAATAVTDAELLFIVEGQTISYVHDPARPGRYQAAAGERILSPRSRFSVEVRWQRVFATASGVVPPPIRIDSVSIVAPAEPIAAVFADSLSLNLREGFMYPVEVTIWWHTDFAETAADSAYWVRTKLTPPASFPSAVVGFFLRTEQILREKEIRPQSGTRRWVGVYGVPVETDTTRMPVHTLELALLRGSEDYAQYAASRQAPEQRDPVTNVTGGVGIVTGVSVDRKTLEVRPRP